MASPAIPISLAYVGLAQFLPMLLLLIPAGDLADRISRKRMLAASWSVAALCAALLLWLSTLGEHGVGGIYAGAGAVWLQPRVHRARHAKPAAADRAARTSGPGFGHQQHAHAQRRHCRPRTGWRAVGLGGGELTYAVCAVALALAVLLLWRVPVKYAAPRQVLEGTMWQRAADGFHFIRSRPIVLGTVSLDLFAVLLGGVVALLPVYAKEVLHTGPEGLGLLRSAMAGGEVLMGLWLSARPIQRHVGKVMFAAVAVLGLANLVFALSHWFWLSMAMLALAGAADMVSVYIRSALVQFSTPDTMRGRVNAVNMLFISSSNELGEFRAGCHGCRFRRCARRHSRLPVHLGRGGHLDAGVQALA